MNAARTMPRVAAWPMPEMTNGFFPALMLEVELTRPLPTVGHDGRHRRAWVLALLLWPELREQVVARFAAAGLPQPAALTRLGLRADPSVWPFLIRRQQVLAAAPFVSVVICTRDRPDRLAACLRHLDRQDYPRFEVLVVDNAPGDNAVQVLVGARQRVVTCRYVAEPRAGLSWARNAGIAAAAGDIIDFL